MGLLRKGLSRDLLLLLAFAIDEFNSISFKKNMAFLTCGQRFSKSSFASTVSKMLSVGEIEKIEKKGQVYYQMTSAGGKILKESIPIFSLAEKKWDGYWRLVIFDIREKKRWKRESLRNKLKSLGFGLWQRSVYVSPHDFSLEINQFLKNLCGVDRFFSNISCWSVRG